MGIWIRSQDKCTLINVNKIQIADFHNLYKNAIWGDDILLGIYSSKEKALKVLDMIETHLEELEYKIHDREVVFKMPDDEVKENE